MITIHINGTDRSDSVRMLSVRKNDNINERVDELVFEVLRYGERTFVPQINDEVVAYDGATKMFGGVIVYTNEDEQNQGVVRYSVHASDYQTIFARRIVLERFRNTTANDVVRFLVEKYSVGFTTDNVVANITIESITFDRIPLTEALDKLAKLLNYSWYIDYDKDVHFFAKNEEAAPFNLTTNDGNYISDSLEITRDLSQLRNRVTVRGGEIEGEPVTQTFDGDGVKIAFVLAYKFSSLPTVLVDSVPQTVGIAYLQDETAFDCVWSFSERSLRFQTPPATGANNIEVTEKPIFAIVVTRTDSASVNALKNLSRGVDGIFEYSIEDVKIRSREEAIQRGIAELDAYANGVIEGLFETYTAGLRSGQTININIPHRNIDEDFIIQRVLYQQISKDKGQYRVMLATARTMGIISVLQDLLQKRGVGETDQDLILTQVQVTEEVEVDESYTTDTQDPPYVIAPSDPDDDVGGTSYLRINMSTIAGPE